MEKCAGLELYLQCACEYESFLTLHGSCQCLWRMDTSPIPVVVKSSVLDPLDATNTHVSGKTISLIATQVIHGVLNMYGVKREREFTMAQYAHYYILGWETNVDNN